MKALKLDIRNLTLVELADFFIKNNAPRYRAKQVYKWLWKYRVLDFDKMTDLSLRDRDLLKDSFTIKPLKIIQESISEDGTIKFLFEIYEGQVVEGVLIPQRNRLTACISSQVGCSLACDFCATGKLKMYRNLTSAEIYDQAFLINEYCLQNFKKRMTNIVFMGMGEPLLNIKNVLQGINHITGSYGMDFSGKRIVVSTAGIVKIIRKIADNNPKFGLAISLHSANDSKRSRIMEINKTNNLSSLLSSLKYFYEKTKIKPTYEYILLKGFNDSRDDAEQLVNFCKKIPSKVNLIEYNKVEKSIYEKTTFKTTQLFIDILEKNNILVKLRRSRGEDIGAACGQLATENTK